MSLDILDKIKDETVSKLTVSQKTFIEKLVQEIYNEKLNNAYKIFPKKNVSNLYGKGAFERLTFFNFEAIKEGIKQYMIANAIYTTGSIPIKVLASFSDSKTEQDKTYQENEKIEEKKQLYLKNLTNQKRQILTLVHLGSGSGELRQIVELLEEFSKDPKNV